MNFSIHETTILYAICWKLNIMTKEVVSKGGQQSLLLYVKEPLNRPPVVEMNWDFACRAQMGSTFLGEKNHDLTPLQMAWCNFAAPFKDMKFQPQNVGGIIWGQYRLTKSRGLRSDHGGHTRNWSKNRGHSKTSMLLRLQASSLACGDHLGSVLICQNYRTQISPWRPH